MVVWWSICVYSRQCQATFIVSSKGRLTRSNIPSRRKDEQICQRRIRIAGFGCQHAEDGGIDVVDGDGADVDEFGQVVFVGDLNLLAHC